MSSTDDFELKEQTFIRKRFTLVIPAKIRTKLALKEDEPVEISLHGNQIIVTPIRENPIDQLTRFGEGVEYNRKSQLQAEQFLKKLVKNKNKSLVKNKNKSL